MESLVHYLKTVKVGTKQQEAKKIQGTINKYGDISIGTDVEFLWFSKEGNFISAEELFRKNGVFGTDGRCLIGEFRTSPCYCPNDLIKIFEHALSLCDYYLTEVKRKRCYPVGMSYYSNFYHDLHMNESIGTHVHLGNPNLNRDNMQLLVSALDYFVLPFTKLVEPDFGNTVRTGIGYYGDLSDYRTKPYGVEYRSFPCFFDDKEFTRGIFALCKIICFECLPGRYITKELLNCLSIDRTRIYDKQYLKTICNRSSFLIKRLFKSYSIYKQEIDYILNICTQEYTYPLSSNRGIFDWWGTNSEISYLEKEILRKGIEFFPRTVVLNTVDNLSNVFSLSY